MSNMLLRAPRAHSNADLVDQLESLSQRTAVAALDAALAAIPAEGPGFAAAAAKLALVSAHVVTAAQQLEPTLVVGS